MSMRRAKDWFDRTLFVIVADHTHKGRAAPSCRRRTTTSPHRLCARARRAGRVDTIASQIDVGPTILGVARLRLPLAVLRARHPAQGASDPRALLANYQTVG